MEGTNDETAYRHFVIKACIDINKIRLLILERKDEVKEKFKAEVVGIFGSYARGEENEQRSQKIIN